MENYNLIIAGVIGSTITLFLTAIIDFIKEKYHTNQLVEIRPVVKSYQPTTNIIKRLQFVVNCTSQKSAISKRNRLLYSSLNICGIILYHWLIVRIGHKR